MQAPATPSASSFSQKLQQSIEKGQSYLLSLQKEDGHWIAPLDTDPSLTAEYLLLAYYLREREPRREEKALAYLLKTQNQAGGWSIYPGYHSDVSCTVKCYFALKLLGGYSPEEPLMQRACAEALKYGGLHRTYIFTKVFLALFGQYSWEDIPAMPVEIMLSPQPFYFNIYEISYWARTITVPLTLIYTLRKSITIPQGAHISELITPGSKADAYSGRRGLIPAFFSAVDVILKFYMKHPSRGLRRRAVDRAEQWMLEHFQESEGLGAIYPAMLNALVALSMLGYTQEDSIYREQWRYYTELMIEDKETLRLQPCISPVWDTALSLNALNASGLPKDHPAKQKAAYWLMSKQATREGDWKIKNPQGKSGGWAFQYENDFYPDTDDSAVVIMGLQEVHLGKDQGLLEECLRRGTEWLLSMQNKDGGWGAFERENNKEILNHLPFIDYGALLDPSTADVTGRVLEMLGQSDFKIPEKTIRKAVRYLIQQQESDGCWYGRWGVNYIYGSWSVLSGLKTAKVHMKADYVQKCVQWIKSKQNEDGGWGESCYTYEDALTRGQGKSTPSQTAWALLALIHAEEPDSPILQKGVEYLIQQQLPHGDFLETEMTGTGFPCILYLQYHYYRLYFPLKALALYQQKYQQGD